VVIATPVISHVELCTRSSSRASPTFVEKPLATSSAIADELIQLAAVQGRAPMCGHTFVCSPAVRAMKRMLEQRVLGHVYFVSSSRVNVGLHNATQASSGTSVRMTSDSAALAGRAAANG
jgi:predicted dehydrogenase